MTTNVDLMYRTRRKPYASVNSFFPADLGKADSSVKNTYSHCAVGRQIYCQICRYMV